MSNVTITGGAIRIDDRPTQILSGTIHYFRFCPEQWADRIAKAKMMGLNTIETYLAANLHHPAPGRFDFTGMLNFEQFLDEVAAAGLYAIVRPGPYICAEWENGGIPPWYSTVPGMEFRCANEHFLNACGEYLDAVLPRLRRHLASNGGPIIALQIENEYGSFGCDKTYLERLRDITLANGIDVPLFTSDGPEDWMLQGGTIPGVFQTVNFGSRAAAAFKKGREYQPEGPDFCMEFWNGWFDHWGEKHHTRTAEDAAATLDEMLSAGASVNFYVFCGGTNFGFLAGANGNGDQPGDYAPTVTSYDYDAPINEAGDPTEKFFRFQEVIRRYRPDAPFGTPDAVPKLEPFTVTLTESAPLLDQLDNLATKHLSLKPPTMEACKQSYGFIHYRTRVNSPLNGAELYFPEVRDRVMAFMNGTYLGAVYRNDATRRLPLTVPAGGGKLDLLVENLGRINYGPLVGRDLKGLPGGACIYWQQQTDFEVWNLELEPESLTRLTFGPFAAAADQPAFHRGEFELKEVKDTFLAFPGVKGVVWVNGFNLGRYWNIGPGETLYVPAPVLKEGKNEIIVLELHQLSGNTLSFRAEHTL